MMNGVEALLKRAGLGAEATTKGEEIGNGIDAAHLNAAKTLFWIRCSSKRQAEKSLQENHNSCEEGLAEKVEAPAAALVESLRKGTRIARLCEAMDMTRKEGDALAFLLLHCSGSLCIRCDSGEDTISLMQKATAMNGMEAIEFFDENRVQSKEGIIELSEEFASSWNQSSVKIPPAVMKALWGGQMNGKDLLKLGNDSHLIEVLKMEPEYSSIEIAQAAPLSVSPGDDDASDDSISGFEVEQMIEVMKLDEESMNDAFPVQDGEEVNGFSLYTSDLDYLADCFEIINLKFRKFKLEQEDEGPDAFNMRTRKPEAIRRELDAKIKAAVSLLETKLFHTLKNGFTPRMENIASRLRLTTFEKFVVLTCVSTVISPASKKYLQQNRMSRVDVGTLISLHAGDVLKDQVNARKYFYRRAALVKGGIVSISESQFRTGGDLIDCSVEIDRRMVDFIVGIDTEIDNIIEGGECFTPKVKWSDVVLPPKTIQLLKETVDSNQKFAEAIRRHFGETEIQGKQGCILLFHGPPGTGKTLTAHALIHSMGKKMLRVNCGKFLNGAADLFKFIFREARLQDAVIFLDECEPLFASREKLSSRYEVNEVLESIEAYEGFIILATNRPCDLDAAMQRRISLCIAFRNPGASLRKELWLKHIPKSINLADDVDFSMLAENFDLNGGYIKNAAVLALRFAIAQQKASHQISLSQSILVRAARQQVRTITQPKTSVTPIDEGMDSLVAPKDVKSLLRKIIDLENARRTVNSDWELPHSFGLSILISGPRGTGKHTAARALAFESGKSCNVYGAIELLRMGYNGKQNQMAQIFKDARNSNSLLVIDSFEYVLKLLHNNHATHVSANQSFAVNECMYHIQKFAGLAVLISDEDVKSKQPLPKKLCDVIDFAVSFAKPTLSERIELWKKKVPRNLPLAADVNLSKLSELYEFNGLQIERVIFRVAIYSLKTKDEKLQMKDFRRACQDEKRIAALAASSFEGNIYM